MAEDYFICFTWTPIILILNMLQANKVEKHLKGSFDILHLHFIDLLHTRGNRGVIMSDFCGCHFVLYNSRVHTTYQASVSLVPTKLFMTASILIIPNNTHHNKYMRHRRVMYYR